MSMVASGLGTRCLPLACPSWTACSRSVRNRAHQSKATTRLPCRMPVARSTLSDSPTGGRQHRLLAAQDASAQSPTLPRSGLPRSCPPAFRPRLASRQVGLASSQSNPFLELLDEVTQLGLGRLLLQVLQHTQRRQAVLEQQDTGTEQLQVQFDNSSDTEATVINLSGHDRPDLLHVITGAIGELSLNIVSAATRTLPNEEAVIVLKVTSKGKKVSRSRPSHLQYA